jgi:putative hydrolase of the HAD superfamily
LIKALLWDVDGVFVDTEEMHFRSWQWLVEKEGGSPLTIEEYAPCIGHSGAENIATIAALKNLQGDIETMRLARRKKFEELCQHGISLFDANIKLLRDFVLNFPYLMHAVVSAASKSDIKRNLDIAKIENLFDIVISYEENGGMRRKPAPDMYLLALDRLNLPSSECIAFEDTCSGTVSATAAHIKVVALPNQLTKGQDFTRASLILQSNNHKSAAEILSRIDTITPTKTTSY